MPLHPQAEQFLERFRSLNIPPIDQMNLEQVRAMVIPTPGSPEPIARKEDRVIPAADGSEIPARVYWPDGWSEDSDPLTAVVYFHGGGWVIGTLEIYDAMCHAIANRANCIFVSVDYRMAPEYQFPTAAEDCHTATVWVSDNADELGVNAERIAVAGDSAGGNLATVVSLMARDRSTVSIAHQILIYPITDHNFETTSYVDNGDEYFLTRHSMKWFWDQYVPEEADRENPYASPLRADSLTGLPPAYLMTAEYDPLRDEAEEYAKQLEADGVDVDFKRYDGMIHGFFRRVDLYDRAIEAQQEVADVIRSIR
jgi:acetyl esterase